jgi:hypothetical protein
VLQKAEAAAAPAADKEKKTDEESLDPTAYFENRVAAVDALAAAGVNPYPHKFACSTSIPDLVATYSGLADAEQLVDVTVAVAGRLHSLRSSSSKLQFYDLRADGAKVQVMMNFEVRRRWCRCLLPAPCCLPRACDRCVGWCVCRGSTTVTRRTTRRSDTRCDEATSSAWRASLARARRAS